MLLTTVRDSGYRPVWLALFTYLLNIARTGVDMVVVSVTTTCLVVTRE